MNLPNALAVFRIGAALAIAAVELVLPTRTGFGVAAALFASAVVSDIADGPLARRLGGVTRLGAFLDAAADKVLVLAVLAPVAVRYQDYAVVVLVLVARDLTVTWWRASLLARGATLEVTRLARLKTALLFAGCQIYLVSGAIASFGGIVVAEALVAAGVVAALLSAAQYLAPRFAHA